MSGLRMASGNKKKILIIGAGVGGLATGLRLAHRGHEVTILEKNDFIGGRNFREFVGGCRFDAGPTLLMMLDPFRKLFADVGESFDDSFALKQCDPSYRVFYSDGVRLDGTTNQILMTKRIAKMSGVEEAKKFPSFMAELKDLYDQAIPNFVRKNYRSVFDFASPAQVARVFKHRMLGNLADRVNKRFQDPKLQMLFSFQTMYLGLSPYDAPWVYSTLAYMEYGEGIYYCQGGLPAIGDRIASLALQRGATIRLQTAVKAIEGKNVLLESGETLTGDIVIANPDLPYVQKKLSKVPKRRKYRYSCSAHLLYIDYDGELDDMEHHNVFFGRDFTGNLNALFRDFKMPNDPAFYACITKKSDATAAPPGRSNLMLLIPIPNLTCKPDPTEIDALEADVMNRLRMEVGLDSSKILDVKRRSALDWRREFNLVKGAAFGISHDLRQSAFMRPQNRSATNKDLYYVGASTVPGNGLPMVLISAELVEQRLIQEGAITA